jgi:hypothetical protein
MGAAFNYDALPVFEAFERVSDPSVYTPLPDDWVVGVADVVKSTDALQAGRYKAVNMAGAAVVGAVRNALASFSFPFVFGGDGAIIAVSAEAQAKAAAAMAATARYVAEELQLELRVGMMPVAAIRAAGQDLRVARYAASAQAVYAMFSGGGASLAEAELKAGRIALPPAPQDARPDLTGLSCRWRPMKSRQGNILSVVVIPTPGASPAAFREIATEVVTMTSGSDPVPPDGPEFTIDPAALRLEARATRKASEAVLTRLAKIAGEMFMAVLLDNTNRSAAGFDPKRYRTWVARNTDFRKFDDGLRMTVDCTPEQADALEAFLAGAEAERIVDYGLYRQDAALMTCIVPSAFQDDHVHFLDGAGGGYAQAAKILKDKRTARDTAGAALVA